MKKKAKKVKKKKVKPLIPKYPILNAMRKLHKYSNEYKLAKETAKVDKSLYECRNCGDLYYKGESQKNYEQYVLFYQSRNVYKGSLELDHIVPVVCPEQGYQGLDEYARRLFCKKELLSPVCKNCHSKITEEQRKKRKKS